jgi:HlyD family secretion protein
LVAGVVQVLPHPSPLNAAALAPPAQPSVDVRQLDRKQDVGANLERAARSRRRRRWWWVVGLAVALLSLSAVLLRSRSQSEPGPSYVSVAVVRNDLRATVTATGTLKAVGQVEVGAEISGRVISVSADFNDRVAEGQVLAQLDPTQLRAAVRQASAQLAANRAGHRSAVAAQEEAELAMQRSELLFRDQLLSLQSLEAARASARRAGAAAELSAAQIELAQAALDSVRTSLDKAVIRAPMAGVVLSRNVEPGQTVAATFAAPVLFTLARDLTRMELHIQIDEADVGQIAARQAASFVVDAFPARTFPAELTAIHDIATTQSSVVTYEALLLVSNTELALRPGMTATVTIVTAERRGALLIPNAALRFTPPALLPAARGGAGLPLFGNRQPPRADETPLPTGPAVWVLEGNLPRARLLQLGLSDGEWTEVVGGELSAGELVLTDVVTRRN